jgi:hypothetical protein
VTVRVTRVTRVTRATGVTRVTRVTRVALLAVACAAPPRADLGWISQIAADPGALRPVLDVERDGWIAWHDGRPWDARLPAEAAARATWDHALLLEDLSALHHAGLERLVAAWAARGTLPADTAAWGVLAASRVCHGAPLGDAAARAAATPHPADHPALAARPAEAPTGAPPAPAALLTDATSHVWQDPCAELTLAQALGATPPPATPDDLGALLFAPWLTGADWRAAMQLGGEPTAALASLPSADAAGLTRSDPATTAADDARAAVVALGHHLDAASVDLSASPGGPILADLQIIARQRQRWMTDRARALLRAGNTAAALATLEPAVDVTHRGVGPTNAASTFVLLAHARLAAGRAREALDALQPVVAAYPAAAAVREVLGDLSALEGLDRLGDSKEL